MTEYWLQKKTLGGWSHVTWYDSLEEANTNFDKATKGDTGYSWRIIEAKTIKEKLLEDHVEPEAPPPVEKVKDKFAAKGWGSSFKASKLTPELEQELKKPWGTTIMPIPAPSEHGMVGKVWMIHHALKQKKRVDPAEVDGMIAQGFERGGPKTQFREG